MIALWFGDCNWYCVSALPFLEREENQKHEPNHQKLGSSAPGDSGHSARGELGMGSHPFQAFARADIGAKRAMGQRHRPVCWADGSRLCPGANRGQARGVSEETASYQLGRDDRKLQLFSQPREQYPSSACFSRPPGLRDLNEYRFL